MARIFGTTDDDVLHGSDDVLDSLFGLSGNDRLYGGDGKDTLVGGEGADVLDGGDGGPNFDLAVYSDSQVGVVIDMATGRGFGGTAQGDRLISIERIIGSNHNDTLMGDASGDDFLAAAGNDTLKGFGGDDFLSGEDGDDTLKGAGGADSLLGGAGSDTAAYQDSPTRVFVSLLNNTARFGDAEGDILKSIENVTGSAFNDELRGNDGVNALNGMGGNDRLDGFGGNDTLLGDGGDDVMNGGTGSDSMAGGRGNDLFFVDSSGDRVTERAGAGVDVVLTSVGYSLSTDAEVETLKTVDPNGTDAIFLFGSSIGNTIIGNDGFNTISGEGGVDHMTGRGGNDGYFVDNAGDVVVESDGQGIDNVNALVNYTLGAGVAVEVLQAVNGAGVVRLTGNELANTVIGNAGNDVLDGSGGVDTLAGQSGNDSFFVDNAADKIVERSGVDTVNASVSYTLEAGVAVETLRTDFDGDTTALRLTGNELANTVIGNAGNNVLNGGGGVDTLQGLDGNDSYFVDNAADKIVESGGIDSVNASVSYNLAAGVAVETLRTTNANGTAAINLAANEFRNIVTGNAGNNVLNGGGGVDTLQGLEGNDAFFVDHAADRIVESAGIDNVNASVSYTLGAGVAVETLRTSDAAGTAAIKLTGNELTNTVTGNAGSNAVNGGLGNDKLTGNSGNDFFVFNTVLNPSTNVDTITDFVVSNDTVRLDNAVFTGLVLGSVIADAFHIGAAAADAEDRIVYNSATGALSFDADGTGAGGLVKFAQLTTGLALTNADFVVV